MLKISNLSKSYPQRGLVLDNLDLEIIEKCSLAITGPSGSGKTTLLNIIGGLLLPDSGKVFFKDSDISLFTTDEAAAYRNNNVGFVFQDHLLMPHLTVIENICLPLLASLKNKRNNVNSIDYALSLMEKTGILELKNKFPSQISGGEAQRATLVRALINKPSLILADEPTGSLDSANSEVLADVLTDLNKELGTTLIVVTHSKNLAAKMQKQLHIEKGILRQ